MKVNRNTPAFTIMEMMVALMISSVVIVMVYAGLLLFNKQFLRYQSTTKSRNEYLLFRNALQSDIENAISVKDTLGQTILKLVVKDERLVRYDFRREYLLRAAAGVTDTFFCKGEIIRLEHISADNSLVRRFFVNLGINNTVMPVCFEKEYAAQQLIREETEASE